MKEAFLKGMMLLTVILMDILGGAEVDLFVPSFPEISDQFNLTPVWLEALLSINFAGYCLSLLFVGGLADRFGRKPIILCGLFIFTIGCILCLTEISYNFLLVGRFFQGIGIAAPTILAFLIIADSYPIKQQQYFMGVLNGLMNISVAAAPVVGSYITMHFHWQGNFITLLLLGLITTILTILFIPNSKPPIHMNTLSLRGYIPIFRSKPLMILIAYIVFSCVPYWVFLGMSPILYMEDLGVSLAHYGYYQGAWALVFALGSIFFGLIINKVDQKKMLHLSGYLLVIGLMIIVLITVIDCHDPLLITLGLIPFSLGTIIPCVLLYPLCLNYIPQAKGRISAVIHGSRLVLTAISHEFAGYFYTGSFQNIGIILLVSILVAIITFYGVFKNNELIKLTQKA